MPRRRRITALGGTIALIVAVAAVAQDFAIDWHTIDGGGEMFSTGGDFELGGTIGQPDANEVVLTGGDFELVGGFWAAVPPGCVGDLDGDGDTDLADLGILLADFGCGTPGGPPPPCVGDLDGDGDTDLADLDILLADFSCVP